MDAWNAEAVVGPQQMGRSAAKVESVEETLKSLENSMEGHAAILRSYLAEPDQECRLRGASEVARVK